MSPHEAGHVNVICSCLLGPLTEDGKPRDESELTSALASLAELAHKTLGAGWNGGVVVERRKLEHPEMGEAAACIAAVDLFARKMRPRKPRPVRDLIPMIDDLSASLRRLRAVTRQR
ncbi:MAG TPA: hypothetical protein VG265_14140 [Gaiellaceae bacterium]|jgi:hypothetical protein|nr:hypothetical protein [Gaiellaceae bacterium]